MEVDPEAVDEGLSLAERRPRRTNRKLPARYRDEQPAPQAALPPSMSCEPPHGVPSPYSPELGLSVVNGPEAARPKVRRVLKSPCNAFGLFRQYHAEDFPAHDPEAEMEIPDMSEVLLDHKGNENENSSGHAPSTGPTLLPYPNQSAFLLGEWYWNGNSQKTKEEFEKLTRIICHQDFKPAEIQGVNWDSINKHLGEAADSEGMWFDEHDAGWMETSVTIPIPFHRRTKSPGPRDYTFPPFLHRSIVAVLREKMANLEDFRHFHLEPYELRWREGGVSNSESIRVHGELYTSPTFLEANEEIQAAPPEPGCTLPRVLVGLMFASDGTQLTSFGDTALWPCYLYFGNESKYRRNKPTCNLCNHIAYFHKVAFVRSVTYRG